MYEVAICIFLFAPWLPPGVLLPTNRNATSLMGDGQAPGPDCAQCASRIRSIEQ
jgi:hypothetical protein